jgi:tetratricopeptide (TPR) repeat protein
MENSWFIKKIYEIATRHFHKWYGLLSALLLLVVVSLIVYRLIPTGEVPFVKYGIGVIVAGAVILIGWAFHVWKYPKRSRTRLGVVIAVQVEDLEVYKFLQKDFLAPFKSKIHELNLPFDVLVLKNHQSEKVETVDDVRKVLKKTRAHFCIWGSIKKRKNAPAGEKYLFSLRGIVVHKPIQEVQKVLLRKEFDALLPNTLIFEEHLQFEIFEFRANQAVAALDYITGRAALLSGDFNIAIRLHESLFNAIQSGQQYPISKDTLKNLLSLEYDQKASFEFFNPTAMGSYVESVKKSLQYNQYNYGALLKRAIVEFDGGNGNPQTALSTIKEAKQRAPNGAYHWLYSKAFLHFWLEQYDDAIQSCEKLKGKSYGGEEITVQEVIKFNENLLTKFDKPQLYYWIGFVSIVKNKNLSLADRYFQNFIEKSNGEITELKTRAESYLSNIKKEIGY